MDGFIKLSRRFFDNRMWQTKRAFSECEAWLDLIQSARFEQSEVTIRVGAYDVTFGKGQYPASTRFLARKWGRSEQWVRSFLTRLRKEDMITMDNTQGVNVITLVNFDKYNDSCEKKQNKKEADNTPINTPCNTPNNTLNGFYISELQRLVTHLSTHLVTHPSTHSDVLHISPVEGDGDGKGKGGASERRPPKKERMESVPTSSNPDYEKFNEWVKRKAPFCSDVRNFPNQITEAEFIRLKERYSGKQIAEIIEQIENRKDLRKRYVNLYRTVLNWAKREYGD